MGSLPRAWLTTAHLEKDAVQCVTQRSVPFTFSACSRRLFGKLVERSPISEGMAIGLFSRKVLSAVMDADARFGKRRTECDQRVDNGDLPADILRNAKDEDLIEALGDESIRGSNRHARSMKHPAAVSHEDLESRESDAPRSMTQLKRTHENQRDAPPRPRSRPDQPTSGVSELRPPSTFCSTCRWGLREIPRILTS